MRFYKLLLFFVIQSIAGLAQKNNIPPGLDSFVNKTLQVFNVPGASVAIVHEGNVLLTRGYGIKELGHADPVDEHTLFCIASNTKAFTAAAIIMLTQEGKLELDKPVINYLPWFRLSNNYVTAEITVRDLLVHRSGMGTGTGDLLQFPPTTYNRKEIVQRMKYLPLEMSFRSGYAYSNGMFLVAAEVIEAVSGQTWEEFVKSRILEPLGMNESIPNISGLMSKQNIARPHQMLNGKLTRTEIFPTNQMGDAVNPAGGISSNAVDMAKWLLVQLDSGRINSTKRLYESGAVKDLWNPVTPVPVTQYPSYLAPAQMNFAGYAPGFHVRDYRREKIVTHTGGLSGAYYSRVSLIPERKLGVAVLTNMESRSAFDAISNYIIDYYLNAPAFDWISGYKKLDEIQAKNLESRLKAQQVSRDTNSKPSVPLSAFAGTYTDPGYGDVVVFFNRDSLAIRFKNTPVLSGQLEHFQNNSFIARWSDRSLRCDAYVTFVVEMDGTVNEIKMKALPGVNFSRDFHNLRLKRVTLPETSRFRAIPRVDSAIRAYMAAYGVPGASIAITKNGKLVYSKGYGYADEKENRLVNDSSLFRIASISKTFTALSILQLVQQGKLSVDDRVFGKNGILGKKYRINNNDTRLADIRVRHLLNHTAGGWKNGRNIDPIFLNDSFSTDAQIRWTLANQLLDTVPGVQYAYSNFGYWLLGEIVSVISGMKYEDYVKKNILKRVQIEDMDLGETQPEKRKANEVTYYGQIPTQSTNNWNMRRIGAAGGWIATARDLVKYLAAIEGKGGNEALLSKQLVDSMTTLPDVPGTNYAFGWRVNNGNWWHQGSLPGTGTQLLRGANGVSCAFLCNSRGLGSHFFTDMEKLLLKITSDSTINWPDPVDF
ncbi:MAG TPA: serine hydrolase [Parasegetibacter sp.]